MQNCGAAEKQEFLFIFHFLVRRFSVLIKNGFISVSSLPRVPRGFCCSAVSEETYTLYVAINCSVVFLSICNSAVKECSANISQIKRIHFPSQRYSHGFLWVLFIVPVCACCCCFAGHQRAGNVDINIGLLDPQGSLFIKQSSCCTSCLENFGCVLRRCNKNDANVGRFPRGLFVIGSPFVTQSAALYNKRHVNTTLMCDVKNINNSQLR